MIERNYLNLMEVALKLGASVSDRTGVGTSEIFGAQLRHSLASGFPLLTTKKVHFKSIVHELIWMLRGDTNIKYLQDNGVSIWDEWADENGNLGPVYGKQWRKWLDLKHIYQHTSSGNINMDYKGIQPVYIDQVDNLISKLQANPHSRDAIVSAWNPSDLPAMALRPCHVMWQVNLQPAGFEAVDAYMKFQKKIVSKHNGWEYAKSQYHDRTAKYILNLSIYQRSADMFLGVPFNLAFYSLLMVVLCNQLDAIPGDLIWSAGSVHVYNNHRNQVKEQLERRTFAKDLPVVHVDRDATVDNLKFEDVHLYHYNHLPAIKAPVAV